MNLQDLKARVDRLGELAQGLSREMLRWKEGNDPLLYLERKAYLAALQKALAAVEDARIVLARARRRLQPDE